MFVPLLLDQVRVKDRPEVLLVFRLDRDKQTADLLCLGPDTVEQRPGKLTLARPVSERHVLVCADRSAVT
jgi:hypothetical protein